MKIKFRKTDGPEYEVVMTGAIGDGDEAVLATVYDGVEPYTPKELASLYAAAPELLEAAKNARNVLAGLITGDLKQIKADSPALLALRAAITKAEGR